MTGYTVHTQAVRAHARKLDALHGDVNEAVGAAVTTLNPAAFGVLCSFLYPAAAMSEVRGIAAIEQIGSTLQGLAAAVRKVADGYDNVDQAVEESFTKLESQLASPGSPA
jgi:methyl-accepting chemotaxis protein